MVEHPETGLRKLLLKIPSPSWGWMGYKWPTLLHFISNAIMPVVIIVGFSWGLVGILCLVKPFPLNYIIAGLTVLPLVLLSTSERFKHLIRLYQLNPKKWHYNPNAISEYLDLVKAQTDQ